MTTKNVYVDNSKADNLSCYGHRICVVLQFPAEVDILISAILKPTLSSKLLITVTMFPYCTSGLDVRCYVKPTIRVSKQNINEVYPM